MRRCMARKEELITHIRIAMSALGMGLHAIRTNTKQHHTKTIETLKIELIGLRNQIAKKESNATADTTCNQQPTPRRPRHA